MIKGNKQIIPSALPQTACFFWIVMVLYKHYPTMCEGCERVICVFYVLILCELCERCEWVLCVSSVYEFCVWAMWTMWASSLCELCVGNLCVNYVNKCERVLCVSSIREFYMRVMSMDFMCVSSMREFYVWVLCVSSMCEFYLWVLCVSSMCEFCVRVLCTSFICEFYVWLLWSNSVCELCERVLCVSSGPNQTSSPKNKFGANWGQPDKFAEIQNLGTTGYHGSASSVCEPCLRVLLAARRRAHNLPHSKTRPEHQGALTVVAFCCVAYLRART